VSIPLWVSLPVFLSITVNVPECHCQYLSVIVNISGSHGLPVPLSMSSLSMFVALGVTVNVSECRCLRVPLSMPQSVAVNTSECVNISGSTSLRYHCQCLRVSQSMFVAVGVTGNVSECRCLRVSLSQSAAANASDVAVNASECQCQCLRVSLSMPQSVNVNDLRESRSTSVWTYSRIAL
jgi:hypothetical protein